MKNFSSLIQGFTAIYHPFRYFCHCIYSSKVTEIVSETTTSQIEKDYKTKISKTRKCEFLLS